MYKYPEFIKCFEKTDSVFWQRLLEDFANGDFPPNVYVKNNKLCFGRDFHVSLSSSNLFECVKDLIENKLCFSTSTQEGQRAQYYQLLSSLEPSPIASWSGLKRRENKHASLERYVVQNMRSDNLSLQKARLLISLVFVAFVFKTIDPNSVRVGEGRNIAKIAGVELRNGNIVLNRDIYPQDPSPNTCEMVSKTSMCLGWNNYIKNRK